MRPLFAALLVIILVGNANAANLIKSQMFIFSGWCTGSDMVYRWSIDSKPGSEGAIPPHSEYGKSFVYPWLNDDIEIIGIETTAYSTSLLSEIFGPAHFDWLFIGNSAVPDVMLTVGPDSAHGEHFFPAGSGFFFPGKAHMTPLTYLDMHAVCRWPWEANVFLNIYYSVLKPNQQ